MDLQTFTDAVTIVQTEILDNPDFALLHISDALIFRSIAAMKRHNLNATDAAILALVMEVSHSSEKPVCIVVACDKRLLRAAEAEGFRTLNPELVSAADVHSFLAALASL